MSSTEFENGIEYGIETFLNLGPKEWAETREKVARAMHSADVGRMGEGTPWHFQTDTALTFWRTSAEAAMRLLGFQEFGDDG